MNQKVFSQRLLEWYAVHKRDLPWRNTRNPYFIWLSEIILQQTRVAQGLPYFEKFAANYPNVQALAQAPEEDVMRLWQGLGYYSRARNLHACAKEIFENRESKFPETYTELLQLKGVGSYTAAAIASFAFGEAVAVVDGNVFRVLSRVFGLTAVSNSSKGKKLFEEFANKIIPLENPADFNQAIMEFGALQCTPKNPECNTCPISEACFAYQKGMVESLPIKSKKIKVKERYFQYAHILCGEYTVIKQRGGGDIWQGLFDFPLEELQLKEALQLESQFFADQDNYRTLNVIKNPYVFKHVLTHQKIFANFVKFVIEESEKPKLSAWVKNKGYQMVDQTQLESVAKPRLILKYLNDEK
ncbi:A/G-specific adenine glycosylase [Cecembia sp.]|uniref:A/G-specific adenine glycosylase n=1 Tax=Cecembia sp. TaxID=1898110 RepID=UPI0025C1380B|nr:A/G-specific adenine glycosylase [Cecembia sp.]